MARPAVDRGVGLPARQGAAAVVRGRRPPLQPPPPPPLRGRVTASRSCWSTSRPSSTTPSTSACWPWWRAVAGSRPAQPPPPGTPTEARARGSQRRRSAEHRERPRSASEPPAGHRPRPSTRWGSGRRPWGCPSRWRRRSPPAARRPRRRRRCGPWCWPAGAAADLAGRVAAAIAGPRLAVPVLRRGGRSGRLSSAPTRWCSPCRASGDTEERWRAAEAAWASGAPVVAVTSGGALGRGVGVEPGRPVIGVPAGLLPERAAVGALAVPPLLVLEQLGLVSGVTAELAAGSGPAVPPPGPAPRRGKARRPSWPAASGAPSLSSTGAGPLGAAAAYRWKTQVNENAKSPAFWPPSPSSADNEIAGWGQRGDVTRQLFTLVTLRTTARAPATSGASTWWPSCSTRWWPTGSRSAPRRRGGRPALRPRADR